MDRKKSIIVITAIVAVVGGGVVFYSVNQQKTEPVMASIEQEHSLGEETKEIEAADTYETETEPVEEKEIPIAEEESIEVETEEPVDETEHMEKLKESLGYEVEPLDPTTLYAIQNVNLRQGPSSDDFVKIGSLSARQQVTVTGKVTTYQSQPTLWFQLDSGEFVAGSYLVETLPPLPTTKPSQQTSTNTNNNAENQGSQAENSNKGDNKGNTGGLVIPGGSQPIIPVSGEARMDGGTGGVRLE